MEFFDSTIKNAFDAVKKLLGKHNAFFNILANSLIQRWAIAICLCLILSIILAPEIQLLAPKYKIGMISPKDINLLKSLSTRINRESSRASFSSGALANFAKDW